MAMGRRSKAEQEALFFSALDLPRSPGHPFYDRLSRVLSEADFDAFVEDLCRRFYADQIGRPSLPPGVYFRLLFTGYFEGIDSERSLAWRCSDSLAIRQFLGYTLDRRTPDHSTISKTRRLLDYETHLAVFGWVLERLAEQGLVVGERVAIDATTLEADAAMRCIRRRDDGRSYREYLDDLARAEGVENPSHEDRKKIDRKREKRTSNKDWEHPHDPDARVMRMKDGSTRMGYKAEHGVDTDSGAILAPTVQPGDRGDTDSIYETISETSDQLARLARAGYDVPEEGMTSLVADKGYHSDKVLVDLAELEIKSYVADPKRKRNWKDKEKERQAVHANRRRLKTKRGVELRKKRAELTERSFAHCYETGGLRRLFVRGLENVQKRVVVHAAGFNLGLMLRKLVGVGTPRGLQGAAGVVGGDDPFVLLAWKTTWASWRARWRSWRSAMELRRVGLVA